MSFQDIKIKPLTEKELDQVLALDKICFGGLWSLNGYKREMKSPNSCLLIMTIDDHLKERVIGFASFWAILKEAHITLLAIHPDFQGQGLGRALFRDAALRVVQASDTIGIRGIIVHAISEQAKRFYLALGFQESPLEPMLLMITIKDLIACLS